MAGRNLIKLVAFIIVYQSLLSLASASSCPVPRAAASLQSSSAAAAPSSIECYQFAYQNRFALYMHGYHDVLTAAAVLKTLQEHPALCGWLIAASR
jgi:hypothetical protein